MNDSFLYIRIVSDYPSLFFNVQKNLSFLNHNVLTQTQSHLYIEDIHDGLLYVYKNVELFELLNAPLSAPSLKKLLKSDFQGAQFFFNQIIKESNFPANGVILTFSVSGTADSVNKAIDLYKTYFESYQTTNISTKQVASDTIEVEFKNFMGLQLYAQRLSRFLTDFM